MEVNLNRDGEKLVIAVDGRIDSLTSPQLEEKISELDGVKELIIDLKNVNYISSAGLRVLISMQYVMDDQGSLKIINVCKNVMDIFEATSLTDMFEIEKMD